MEGTEDLMITTIQNEIAGGFTFDVFGYGPGYVLLIAYKQNHGLTDASLLSYRSQSPPMFNANL